MIYPEVISSALTPDIWKSPDLVILGAGYTYFNVANEFDALIDGGMIQGPAGSRAYASYGERFYTTDITPLYKTGLSNGYDGLDFILLPASHEYTHRQPEFYCRGLGTNVEDERLPKELLVKFGDGCMATIAMTNTRGFPFVNDKFWAHYGQVRLERYEPLPPRSDTYFWERFEPLRDLIARDFYYNVDMGVINVAYS